MKNLKSLNKHNEDKNKLYRQLNLNSPQLNGITCPECGEEMYDSNPMMTLTSIPAQKNVHCSKCDYVGYRIA